MARSDVPDGLWRRLAWMAAIWTGSVAALGAVAMMIKAWLG